MRFVSIAMAAMLLSAPIVAPLGGEAPCCPPADEPMVRATSTCCTVGAPLESAPPARLAAPPELATPAVAVPALGLGAAQPVVTDDLKLTLSHAVFLQAPLRI